jgi:hypothetical protein
LERKLVTLDHKEDLGVDGKVMLMNHKGRCYSELYLSFSRWEPIVGTCVQDNEALNTLKLGDIFEYQTDCSISVRVPLHGAIDSCTYMQCLEVLSSRSEPVNATTTANNGNSPPPPPKKNHYTQIYSERGTSEDIKRRDP